MAVPPTRSLYLPLLEAYGSKELPTGELIARVGDRLQLLEEDRNRRVPGGSKTKFASNVSFAKADLLRAGLVRDAGGGFYAVTDRGKEVLIGKPAAIDRAFLRRFPEFAEWERRSREKKKRNSPGKEVQAGMPSMEATMHRARQQAEEALVDRLREHIAAVPASLFEQMLIMLLRRMGYGGHLKNAGIVLGRSGDNGVDGVVKEDFFGLDCLYMQARRYADGRTVTSREIREFFGALDLQRASRGIFFTTSRFSPSAVTTAQQLSKRIELVNGAQLARLMIDFGVGITVEETFDLKKLDTELFSGCGND